MVIPFISSLKLIRINLFLSLKEGKHLPGESIGLILNPTAWTGERFALYNIP